MIITTNSLLNVRGGRVVTSEGRGGDISAIICVGARQLGRARPGQATPCARAARAGIKYKIYCTDLNGLTEIIIQAPLLFRIFRQA